MRYTLSDRQISFLRAVADGNLRGGYKALRLLDNRAPMSLLKRGYISVSSRGFSVTNSGAKAYNAVMNGDPVYRKSEGDLCKSISAYLHLDAHTLTDEETTKTHEATTTKLTYTANASGR